MARPALGPAKVVILMRNGSLHNLIVIPVRGRHVAVKNRGAAADVVPVGHASQRAVEYDHRFDAGNRVVRAETTVALYPAAGFGGQDCRRVRVGFRYIRKRFRVTAQREKVRQAPHKFRPCQRLIGAEIGFSSLHYAK